MKTKFLTSVVVAGLFVGFATSASASSGFESTVNAILGNGASVSCNACHTDGGSSSSATLPMANTYRSARSAGDFTLLGTSDSDGDGYINKLEVNAAGVEFNSSAISPFTKAVAANADANVKALADAAAVSATFADPTGLAGTGKEILGGIKVTLIQADTLYFKAGGVGSTDMVYTVDAAGVGTAVAAADWTVTVDGGLKINALPAGAVTADYVVVRTAPPTVAAAPTAFQDPASVVGCVTAGLTTPLLMLLSLLSIGLLVKRKRS